MTRQWPSATMLQLPLHDASITSEAHLALMPVPSRDRRCCALASCAASCSCCSVALAVSQRSAPAHLPRSVCAAARCSCSPPATLTTKMFTPTRTNGIDQHHTCRSTRLLPRALVSITISNTHGMCAAQTGASTHSANQAVSARAQRSIVI